MGKKLTKEEFIIKGKNIHNNEYDYSKVIYINSRSKCEIICRTHRFILANPKQSFKRKGLFVMLWKV